jgi:ATP-binding cassette subfamily B protein
LHLYAPIGKKVQKPGKALLAKLIQLRTQLPYIPRAAQLIWAAAGRWTIWWALLLLIQGLLPVATVYLTRHLVDTISQALGVGGVSPAWQQWQQPVLLVLLMAGVLLASEIIGALAGWVRAVQTELVQDHLTNLIHSKALALELAFYEAPDSYDSLHRAKVDAINRPVALLENIGNLCQSGLTFVAMAGVLLTFGWWLPVVLVVGLLPALLVIARHTLREHAWLQRTTQTRRKATYYDWLIVNGDAVAELRAFQIGDYFRQHYRTLRRQLRAGRFDLARQQAISQLLAGSIALTTSGAVMAWMVWRVVQGALSLGDLALFYGAFSQGQQLMRTLLGSIGQIYSNLLFLENLFQFLALEPQLPEPAMPVPVPAQLQQGLHFDNITFHYPGSDRPALKDFNLTVPAGQVVAIVGENGAGKSTLLKLLCRLYDPTTGQVTLDGIDLRAFSATALRQRITVLFQQPMHYHLTVAENIALGDLAAQPTRTMLQQAAIAAAADQPVAKLPQGYDTLLGKWFGGAELSGGEWQRVALARAFLRQAPIMILDEPTSAMDSWAEADWMARFRTLAAGRTALIITHRFTTAMQADIIHLMAAGQIIESGSHAELVALGGRYAHSWRQQMQQRIEVATD